MGLLVSTRVPNVYPSPLLVSRIGDVKNRHIGGGVLNLWQTFQTIPCPYGSLYSERICVSLFHLEVSFDFEESRFRLHNLTCDMITETTVALLDFTWKQTIRDDYGKKRSTQTFTHFFKGTTIPESLTRQKRHWRKLFLRVSKICDVLTRRF